MPYSSGNPEYMLPRDVASLFAVNRLTVTRWCDAGRLPSIRTLGGHRRIPRAAVDALLDQSPMA